MKKLINLFICSFVTLFIGVANATVITMEPGDRYADNGFNIELGIADNLFANPYGDGTPGYNTVLTSGNYVAYQYIDNRSISLISGGTWDFTGAFWASAWDSTNQLTLKGYNGANLLYSTTNDVYRQTKQWIQSDFIGITRLTIAGSGTQIAWDNFTFNESESIPEPAPMALIGLGLAGIGFLRKKKAVE